MATQNGFAKVSKQVSITILQCALLKPSWVGLICSTCQYYTANSDCQTTSSHNSRRSAWGRDRQQSLF